MKLIELLIIGTGGFFGAISRYLLTKLFPSSPENDFPWAILIVNVLGSFLFGFISGISKSIEFNEGLRQAIFIGFLGSLTTFSTFSNDNWQLITSSKYLPAAINIMASCTLGILFIFLGEYLGIKLEK